MAFTHPEHAPEYSTVAERIENIANISRSISLRWTSGKPKTLQTKNVLSSTGSTFGTMFNDLTPSSVRLFAGQTTAQRLQPVQSSGETCST